MSDPAEAETARRRRHPLIQAFLVALTVVILLPPAAVLSHRFVDPPITLLMAKRLFEGEGLRKKWRPIEEISPNLVYAVIAAEDAHFCRHLGFDLEAIRKAIRNNERRPHKLRGGSTITQQTAKNVFLWQGRGWVRKGLEAAYTVSLELLWGKRRTMEIYLNVVEWGPGVYGAEAAARTWFGKGADELSPSEAARLAAILPSPRKWKASGGGPYVRRRARGIQAAMGTVRAEGLARCVVGERRSLPKG